MSRIIATAAIRGAYKCIDRAETMLAEAIHRHGRDKSVGFPGTAYALPVILSLVGKRVEKLGDLQETSRDREDHAHATVGGVEPVVLREVFGLEAAPGKDVPQFGEGEHCLELVVDVVDGGALLGHTRADEDHLQVVAHLMA